MEGHDCLGAAIPLALIVGAMLWSGAVLLVLGWEHPNQIKRRPPQRRKEDE